MANDFLPNSYQTPNVYVDSLMHLVTAEEWKAISYGLRRIYGFNKRQDRISLTQFCEGTRGHDGKILDHGTGINRKTIIKILKTLVGFGILIEVPNPNDGKTSQAGTCYTFQTDPRHIDMLGLEARKNGKKDTNQQRTAPARTKKASNSGVSDTPLGGVSDTPLGGVSDTPLGGVSDTPTLNSRKPVENQLLQQRESDPTGGDVVVVDVSSGDSSKPWNTPTYQLLRYHKIGAAKEFAHEPIDLIQAYLDRVGTDYHKAQVVEDLRAGLHRTYHSTIPAPNTNTTPPLDDPLRPIWISPQHWADLTDPQRDVLQGAVVIDGKIVAKQERWTKAIYERWWPMANRLVAAATEHQETIV